MTADHFSPVCHKSAKSSCIKSRHLTECKICHETYPPSLNQNGCPYCANTEKKKQARENKDKKKEDDKKDKKGGKKDNGEGSSKGGKNDKKKK